MRIKVLSFVFTAVLMTNFSVNAQSLDKATEALKKATSKPVIGLTTPKNLSNLKAQDLKLPQGGIKEIKNMQSLGGVATGGGNRLNEYSVGNARVAEKINNAKFATKYALRSFEIAVGFSKSPNMTTSMSPQTEQTLNSLAMKLFGGKETIYDALERAVLVTQLTGPCLDKEGSEKDASVVNDPNICFSVERLATLEQGSADKAIIALLAHEVSHMVGTSEEEASMLQSMVASNLPNDAFVKIPFEVEGFSLKASAAISTAQGMKTQADQGQKQVLCAMAPMLQNAVTTLMMESMNSSGKMGIAFVGSRELNVLYVLLAKTMNVSAYCLAPTLDYMGINQAFQGKNEMSVDELSHAVSPGSQGPWSAPNVKVRHLKDGDKSLSSEMNDILRLLKHVGSKI